MKSLVKTILLISFLANTSFIYGNGITPDLTIRPIFQKTFYLELSNVKNSDFQVILKDVHSNTLLEEEVIQQKSFAKKYNLVNLPNGTYFLEIENEQSIIIQEIKIENKHLIINQKKEKTIFKPTFKLENDHLNLNMLLLESSNVEVTIFDTKNEILLEEKIENQMELGRSYNLSKLQAGAYFVRVEYEDRQFEKTIFLK